MEESQSLLEKFTKNLKKYPTCEVAKFFSEIERKCYDSFNSPQGIIEHEYVTLIGKKRIGYSRV